MPRGGKRTTTWKKGEKPPVKKPKGAKNKRTILKEALGLKNWDQLKGFVESKGIEKCIKELSKMKAGSYVYAYLALTEFVKPRLARTQVAGDPENPLVIHDLSKLSKEELHQLLALTQKAEHDTSQGNSK